MSSYQDYLKKHNEVSRQADLIERLEASVTVTQEQADDEEPGASEQS
jgi:hypothetical protein